MPGLLPVCGTVVCKEKLYDFCLTVYFSRMVFCKVSTVSVYREKKFLLKLGKVMDKFKIIFHTSLLIINILSIIILLQVVFEAVPCWKCDWSIDKVSQINDMAKDFSITVISSTVFYLLLVIIPEKIKQSFVRKRTQNTIDNIANNMQEIIAYLAYKYSFTQNEYDVHYLKINPKSFDTITNFKRNKTGFYYSYCQHEKKELFNVSNWDEISFLYSRTIAIKKMTSDYLDTPGIIYEEQQLVFLIRQIGRCSFIENIEIKCYNNSHISIDKMPDSIKIFYSLYQSLYGYTKNIQELNVGDEDAANKIPIPVQYCPCDKTDVRQSSK